MSEVIEVFGFFDVIKIIICVFAALLLVQIAWEIFYRFGGELFDFLLFIICFPFILLFMIHDLFCLYILCNKDERRAIKEERKNGADMEQYAAYSLHG
jgi:hypothetical protein